MVGTARRTMRDSVIWLGLPVKQHSLFVWSLKAKQKKNAKTNQTLTTEIASIEAQVFVRSSIHAPDQVYLCNRIK